VAQTLIPPFGTPQDPARRPLDATVPASLSLHGADPVTGLPTTWHIVRAPEDAAEPYVVEHAEGEIHSPAVWMQARRVSWAAGEADVVALVRDVLGGGPTAP
jgi:hypothetical protein